MSLLSPIAQANGQASARLRNKVSSHPRQSSGCYNAFSSKQITGLREAFTTIDSDGDGFISRNDIKTMLINLGQNGDDVVVERYMKSALQDGSERINFTQFLTMFGEHLSEVSKIIIGERVISTDRRDL
jgi:myosin regulatory light chain 12